VVRRLGEHDAPQWRVVAP